MAIMSTVQGQNLPATLRYFCLFNNVSSPEGLEKAKDFKLEFILETSSWNALMIGNQGFTKVTAINGPYALTFLEVLKTGVVQSTTIANLGYQAVHSRNTAIAPNELVPSQYYGTCKVLPGEQPFPGK